MKKIALFSLFILINFCCFAQLDTIYLTSNIKRLEKVVDINAFNVVYKNPDTIKVKGQLPPPKELTIPKRKVRLVSFSTGKFAIVSVKNASYIYNNDQFLKGIKDASKYYRHPGGSFFTGATSFLSGGIIGLIPAIACSATTPKTMNLGLPKDAPITDKDYMLGYTARAKKMKQAKVWKSYGAGLVGVLLVYLIFKH